MKAWQLDRPRGTLSFKEIAVPDVRPGSVLVRIEATALLSFLKDYVQGQLPMYNPPKGTFTPGTNGVGVADAIGRDVSLPKSLSASFSDVDRQRWRFNPNGTLPAPVFPGLMYD
jgi:NADPH:quinone reductase-like Zn-dependent oxidoreductase